MKYGRPAKEIIYEYIEKANRPVRASEIAHATGINYNTVRGRLQELKKEGVLKKEGKLWVIVKRK